MRVAVMTTSTEEGLAKILDELNAPREVPLIIAKNRGECWLDSEEFGSAVMGYRGATPQNAHQAFVTLLGLIRSNVGRIRA